MTGALQAHFVEFALPRIRTHARIQFRGLSPEAQEEAVQIALGLAWKAYAREVERGKNPDSYVSAIARFSVRQVLDGRDVTGQEKAKDVLSRRAQRRKHFSVKSLPDASQTLDALLDCSGRPDQLAAFRIAYPEFLAQIEPKKRAVIVEASQGTPTTELAENHGISQGRVSQIRREAFEMWNEFHAGRG